MLLLDEFASLVHDGILEVFRELTDLVVLVQQENSIQANGKLCCLDLYVIFGADTCMNCIMYAYIGLFTIMTWCVGGF